MQQGYNQPGKSGGLVPCSVHTEDPGSFKVHLQETLAFLQQLSDQLRLQNYFGSKHIGNTEKLRGIRKKRNNWTGHWCLCHHGPGVSHLENSFPRLREALMKLQELKEEDEPLIRLVTKCSSSTS